MSRKKTRTLEPTFDAETALKLVLNDWLRSMNPLRGLVFRTVNNPSIAATHAEYARSTGVTVIMTASTPAYARLGHDADTLVLEMTTTMVERMVKRYNPVEPGHWLATDPDVNGTPFRVVVQNFGGVVCSVVTLPGEIGLPPAAEDRGPPEVADGQTRFRSARFRARGQPVALLQWASSASGGPPCPT